ncbi:MAG: enoyl-CoA hydratase [Myxococcaceae bacterium]|nr:enoyl-CoA hydratase [Myxococcaceae bacterium]
MNYGAAAMTAPADEPSPPRATAHGVAGLRALVGGKFGPTAWRTVGQADIDAFARLTGDRQWIHVDVERAAREGPFGTTVAHGNLTLSLIDGFRDELMETTGFTLGVNYGWNKVRFPAPVPSGSRLRGRVEVLSLDDAGGGWWQVVQRWTVEREGFEKPVCVADSVGRVLLLP